LAPLPDLKARTLRTARWTVIRIVSLAILQVIQLATLSRLLKPSDFGEVSIIVVIISLADVFTKTGVDEAILRERGDILRLLDPAWSLQVLRGFFQMAAILAISPILGYFGITPRLHWLLAAASLSPAIDGLRSLSWTLLGKELAIGRVVLSEVAVGAVSICTGIALAILLRSPWAIILNMLAFSVLRTLSTYWIHPHRPRWTLRLKPLRSFLGFGIYFNTAFGIGYLNLSVDRLILGRLLGLYSLGIYDRASMLGTSVKNQLVRFLSAVIFPGFSQLLDSPDRFRRVKRKYLAVLGIFCLGTPLILFPFSDLLVRVIMGPQFIEAIPIFRILLFSTAIHGFALGIQILFITLGQPRYYLHANLAQLATLLLALPLLIASKGIEGACWAVLLADASNLLVTTMYALRGKLVVPAGAPCAPVPNEKVPEEMVAV
jgi:lipopolysaccharide exporter